jgi:hypothetical protein
MSSKTYIFATLAGAVTLFLLGFVFYVLLFENFFTSAAGTSAGVYREEPLIWAIFIGELFGAALLTMILGHWAGVRTFTGGAKSGVIIGLLLGLAINLTLYGTTHLSTLVAGIADAVITLIRYGIAGGVIGLVLSTQNKE